MVGSSSSTEASGAEFATLVDEATPLPVCATGIREAVLGPDHPDTAAATALNNRKRCLTTRPRRFGFMKYSADRRSAEEEHVG
jgi:hypothetical protein